LVIAIAVGGTMLVSKDRRRSAALGSDDFAAIRADETTVPAEQFLPMWLHAAH